MIRRIIVFLFIAINLVIIVSADDYMATKKEFDLNGKIKSAVIKTYSIKEKNGEKIKNNTLTNECNFSKSGKTIKLVKNGMLIFDREFDKKERVIKENYKDEIYILKYKIGKNGKIKNLNVYKDNELIEETEYLYDKNGNKTKENSSIKQTKQHYSSVGISWKYDKKNRIIEEINYYEEPCASELPENRIEYKYDKIGNIALMRKIKYDNLSDKPSRELIELEVEYVYNDKGNIVEEKEWKYDENGIKNNNSTIKKYEYVYDEKNNWTKKTQLIEEKEVELVERKLMYFE